jgi:site-specific DNA recombinase
MKRKPVKDGQGSALIYCRVSTAKQEEKGTSLDSQASACIAKAHELGYTVERVTRETYSGADIDRPELSRDIGDIREKKYKAVIVYAVDRLSRDVAHLCIIADYCEKAGTELIFVTEDLDRSAEGKLMQSIRGYVAEVERQKIRERCVRGKLQKARNGQVVRGGTDLYGYGFDPARGVRVINDSEAVIVRQIYRAVADGDSIRSIIRRLNQQGTPPPSHGKRRLVHPRYNAQPAWGKGAIGRILTDPTYKGEAYAWKWRSGGKQKLMLARPVEEWIALPEGAVPAIVEAELWAVVQERLKTNRGDKTRNEKRPDLLRGLVVCGVCGRRMRGDNEHGQFRVYRCPSRHTPSGACGSARIPAADCEVAAWEKIETILNNPALVTRQINRRVSEGADSRKRLEAAVEAERQSLRKVTTELERIVMRAASADDDTWATFQTLINEKKDAKKRCEEAVANAEAKLAACDANGQQVTAFKTFAARARKRLASFGFEEKRLALEALSVRVNGSGRNWQLNVSLPDSCEVSQSYCSLVRRVRARRCLRNVCRRSCRRSNLMLLSS